MPKFYGVRSHGAVRFETVSSQDVLDLKSAAFTPSAGNHLLFYKSGVNSEGSSDNHRTLWTYDQGTETTINTFTPQSDSGDATTPIIGIKQINFSATSTTLRSKYSNPDGTVSYSEFYRSRLWAWDASHEYAESETEATTTNTAMQDKTTLTFTPSSTQDYLIIWSAEITNSSASYDCKVELTVEGTVVAEGNFEANSSNIYYPIGGLDIANLASGASRTIKIRYCTENAFGTAKIKNARIAAIPLSAYTVNSQETTDASTSSTSYQTAASVTFTPEEKWYLILGSAEVDDTHSLALDANGTIIDEIKGLQFGDTTSKCPIVLCGIHKLTAASQTITLYHKTVDGTTVVARRPRIVVIKLGTDAQLITNNYHQSIEADADDALENETDSVFTVTAADLEAGIGGAGAGDISNIAQRFRNIVIPNAKTVDEAYWLAFMDSAITGTPNLKVKGIDEDNTATFSTLTDWQGRARTTAQIDWDPTSGAVDNLISTPDIKTIVQEIVDRAGWASDNSLALAIDDDGSVTSEFIRTEDFGSDANEMNHLWIRWNEDLGTQYTQTLTEAATLVDAIIKTPNKILTESSTLVDTILKTGGKVLLEAIILVDTALKTAGKVLSEISTLVDDLTAKITNRTLTEVITLIDEFIGKITARVLTETIALVDTITKTTGRIFSEVVSVVDSLLKQGGKVLSEIVTVVDTIQIVLAIQRVFTETVTLVDSVLKQTARTLGDALSLADSILNRAGKTLTESLSLVDTILRTTARILTDALTLIDTVLKQAGRTLTESTALVDTIENLRIKTLTEIITLVDTLTRSIGRAISEAITLADTLLKQGGKQLSEAITLIDTKLATIGKLLIETTALTDAVTRTAGKLLNEATTLVDIIARQTARNLTESVPLADTVVKTIGRTLSEAIALIDEITAKITAKILTEITTLVDAMTRSIGRIMSERLNILDGERTALSFNGSTAYYTVSTFDLTTILTEFTIEFWYKPAVHELNDRIVDIGESGPQNGFTFVQGSSAFNCILRNGSTITGTKSYGNLATDTWHHIIATLKSGTLKGYLNGVVQGSDVTGVVMGDSATTLTVGKRSGGSNHYNGRVKNLKIYTREITSSEAAEHYQSRYASESGLYLWHEHDEATGQTINDRSGNGLNGSGTDLAWVADYPNLIYTAGVFKTLSRTLAEAVSLVDTILNQAAKVLSEAVGLADSLLRTAGKVLTESIPLIDTINRAIGRIFSEAVTLQDTITRTFGRVYQESITLVDSFLKQTAKVLQEAIIAVDTLTRSIGKIMSEAAILADTFLKQTARIFTEALTLADTFTKGLLTAKTFTEQLTLADVFENLIVGARSIGNFILTNIYDLVKTIKQKLKPNYTIAQTKVAYIAKQEARSFTLSTGVQSSYTIQLNKP